MTLSIPDETYRIIKAHREIRWSEIARIAIMDYAEKLDMLNKMASKSRLTEKDVWEFDAKIKRGIHRRTLEKRRNEKGSSRD